MEGHNKKTMIQAIDAILDRMADNYPTSRPSKRPRRMEQHFDELCSILKPCLEDKTSSLAAWLFGSRGSGKTHLIESCLQSFSKHQVRVVRINGLVLKGDDVGIVVREIIRQISDIAFTETKRDGDNKKYDALLRLRETTFTSSLSLLDEILHYAHVDKVPICIILEDFDTMLGNTTSSEVHHNQQAMTEGTATNNNRQLLLYHLLDRIASQGSCLCVIGTTTNVKAVTLLEKRVKSRSEGTSKQFYIEMTASFGDLRDVLNPSAIGGDEDAFSKQLNEIFSTEETIAHDADMIRQVLQRNFDEANDLRWFNRVIYYALSLYRQHVTSSKEIPRLVVAFKEALLAQGASFDTVEEQIVSNPRMVLLKDLSGPQVALLVSARRILARDAEKEEVPMPLNLRRLLQEYQSYNGTADRFPARILRAAFVELLELDVVRPSSDHTGGAPFEYDYACSYYDMDSSTLECLPLHLPLELDTELSVALNGGLLQCSIYLKDWGKKKN